MQAYHNNQKFKEQLIALSIEHREKDQYITGTFGEENINEPIFKGCSVGCTIMDICNMEGIDPAGVDFSDHGFLAEKLGVPVFVTHLQETFFENVSDERRKSWTTEFFSAIQPSANLELVLPKFLKFLLEQTLPYVSEEKLINQKNAVLDLIKVIHDWVESGQPDASAAMSAETAVYCAAMSADCAAGSVPYYAFRSVEFAARWSAEKAAYCAAILTAESAAMSTEFADDCDAFDFYADKFLELIKSA